MKSRFLSPKAWIGVGVTAAVTAGGVYFLSTRGSDHGDALAVAEGAPGNPAIEATEPAADSEYVVIGGVRRKRSDVEREKRAIETRGEKEARELRQLTGMGVTQPVAPDANLQVKSVDEGLANYQKFPERLTPLITPKAFDQAAFDANPEVYLQTIEPGRVFQNAQPGPGVPRVNRLSPYRQIALQGDWVELSIRAQPGAPVTFTSFDLGQFENELASITVQADSNGVAKTRFVGSSGTINDVNILAGSPTSSGQVRFVVHIDLPPVE